MGEGIHATCPAENFAARPGVAAVVRMPLGYAGCALNINGDTVAGEVARALSAERLVFLTDVPGVMDGNVQAFLPKPR